jgi:hypothetical protein
LTGVAEPPKINQKSAAGMSSPGGEETGEGELIYLPASDFWTPVSGPGPVKKPKIAKRTQFSMQTSINQKDMHSNNLAIKVHQGHSNLFKPGHLPKGLGAKDGVGPITVNNTYYGLIRPNEGLFPGKKDCLFL